MFQKEPRDPSLPPEPDGHADQHHLRHHDDPGPPPGHCPQHRPAAPLRPAQPRGGHSNMDWGQDLGKHWLVRAMKKHALLEVTNV